MQNRNMETDLGTGVFWRNVRKSTVSGDKQQPSGEGGGEGGEITAAWMQEGGWAVILAFHSSLKTLTTNTKMTDST